MGINIIIENQYTQCWYTCFLLNCYQEFILKVKGDKIIIIYALEYKLVLIDMPPSTMQQKNQP